MDSRWKRRAKSIGATLGPISWPDSEERLELRKLRIKLIETKDAVEDEISVGNVKIFLNNKI